VAEPWILLPLLTSSDPDMSVALYGQRSLARAVIDFEIEYPDFSNDYDRCIGSLVSNVYSNLAHDKRYFLDKTPRYYFIIKRLASVFPSAKFIFLTRDPISVFDSILKTFCGNRLQRLSLYHHDIFDGADLLFEGFKSINSKRSHHLSYESLCLNSELELSKVFTFLGIDCTDTKKRPNFTDVNFKGSLGDPNKHQFSEIRAVQTPTPEPISLVRRKMYLDLLNSLGDDYYNFIGQSKRDLLEGLSSRKAAGLLTQVRDIGDIVIYKFSLYFGLSIYWHVSKRKIRSKSVFT
jgi:hypothetical protein